MLQIIIDTFFENNFSTPPKVMAVAVSGGADSLALTLLLNQFAITKNIKLVALTVDHKSRANSTVEAQNLAKIFKKLKIEHHILNAQKNPTKKPNLNEGDLREMRYRLLYDFCSQYQIKQLFMAHHLGDVAENFLIRLFRGSQLDGLAAMSQISKYKNIDLCRPLLEANKNDLKQYLKKHKIKWFEDETNKDQKILRNKIRKFLDSFEEADLLKKRIKNAAEIIKDSRDMLDEILLDYAKTCLIFNKNGSFLLNLDKFQQIPPHISLKILSLVLVEVAQKDYKPRLASLKNFKNDIFALKKGKKKDFYGCKAILKKEGLLIKRDEILSMRIKEESLDKISKKKGGFIVDDGDSTINPHNFCFRTVLAKIFAKNYAKN